MDKAENDVTDPTWGSMVKCVKMGGYCHLVVKVGLQQSVPLLNPRDQDLYLDLHQTAHTRKYQSLEYTITFANGFQSVRRTQVYR